MNEQIRRILAQITVLEDELAALVHEQQERLHYRIEGSKVRFEDNLRRIHRELKTSLPEWLRTSEWQNAVSAPLIYGMIVPFVLLDVSLTIFQAVCFRLYRIPRVRRSDYIVLDRQNLGYLNVIEKLNCVYCGYADGLLAYGRQILSRTEMYWCPIKHARKVLDPHRNYRRFADFGDGEALSDHVERMRGELRGAAAVPDEPPASDG